MVGQDKNGEGRKWYKDWGEVSIQQFSMVLRTMELQSHLKIGQTEK